MKLNIPPGSVCCIFAGMTFVEQTTLKKSSVEPCSEPDTKVLPRLDSHC